MKKLFVFGENEPMTVDEIIEEIGSSDESIMDDDRDAVISRFNEQNEGANIYGDYYSPYEVMDAISSSTTNDYLWDLASEIAGEWNNMFIEELNSLDVGETADINGWEVKCVDVEKEEKDIKEEQDIVENFLNCLHAVS